MTTPLNQNALSTLPYSALDLTLGMVTEALRADSVLAGLYGGRIYAVQDYVSSLDAANTTPPDLLVCPGESFVNREVGANAGDYLELTIMVVHRQVVDHSDLDTLYAKGADTVMNHIESVLRGTDWTATRAPLVGDPELKPASGPGSQWGRFVGRADAREDRLFRAEERSVGVHRVEFEWRFEVDKNGVPQT